MRAGAGRAADRRVRGGRDGEVPQPPGRAGGAAREARRRRQVGGLQQVKMQSSLCFISGRFWPSMILCLNMHSKCFRFCYSVLQYELLNLQIPTINIVGSLVKSGIRVLVYRYNAKRL